MAIKALQNVLKVYLHTKSINIFIIHLNIWTYILQWTCDFVAKWVINKWIDYYIFCHKIELVINNNHLQEILFFPVYYRNFLAIHITVTHIAPFPRNIFPPFSIFPTINNRWQRKMWAKKNNWQYLCVQSVDNLRQNK